MKGSFIRTFLIRVRGGEPLPEGVQLDLQRSERVLTWGRIQGGGIAAATDFGLRTTASDTTPPAFHRWHEINRATWDNGELTIHGDPTTTYRLAEPRGVPAAVREHVNATVVVSERHDLGDTHVRVVARRDLSNGRLIWSAIFDTETVTDDQRSRADALLAVVRRRFGG